LIVEIKGVQFVNKGAHLMLLAVLRELHARFPEARISLAPNPNSPYAARAGLGALQALHLRWRNLDLSAADWLPQGLRTRLLRYGIVMEASTDAVLDASGFAYGDAWPERSLADTAAEIVRYARRGRPYVFLPQAFGPFTRTGWIARRFGSALRQATLVYARDAESRAHLVRLDPRLAASVQVAPDFTLQLPGDQDAARRWYMAPGTVLLIPNAHMLRIGASPDPWPEAYVAFMADVARRLTAEGVAVRVLNHGGAVDARLCARIAAQAGALDIINEADPLAIKGIIGAAGAVVCSRYHGCASALAQAVPCLATSWSHKYAALYDEFGVRAWLLADPVPADASRRLLELLRSPDAARASLAQAADTLAARTAAMWRDVGQALGAARP
jgi:polysaccharide pyruvyl transferase WcaK-like protein